MENFKSKMKSVNYVGFTKLDPYERKEIEDIVNSHMEKINRISTVLGMRLHLKPIHEKDTELARQGHLHQIDGVIETEKGHFNAIATHRNPYHAVAEILKKFLNQLKHRPSSRR